LDNQDEDLFKNFEADSQQSHEDLQPCQQEEIRSNVIISDSYHTDILESDEELIPMDQLRRSIATTIVSGVTLPISVNLQILTGPVILPEESLAQSRIAIADSWDYFKVGNFAKVGKTLNAHMPTLSKLAEASWTHQEEAANLGVQGSIMQLLLANRNLDFAGRVFYCKEAIKFAKLSENRDLLAVARGWYGNTYTVCYRQPERAESILNKALSGMNSDSSPLVRSAIYSNLSIAHAQNKNKNKEAENERLSLDYAEQAKIAIPEHPELDRMFQYILWDLQVLESLAGKSFLHLAEHFPNSQYAQMAYDVLEASTGKQAVDQERMSGSLVDKADAARAIGELRHFVDSLGEALPLLASKRRIIEANGVARRVPDEWNYETAVQQLQKDLNHALIVIA
jgi:hypothetical protein